MCGISGVIGINKIDENHEEEVIRLRDSMAHRGPDAAGIYRDSNVCLGHRRLSILDLSDKANQPFIDNEEDIVISFNGEIYNHSEIRKELEDKYSFLTDHSDTEVIIKAYKEWGIDCLQKFNGMFALAIYDRSKGEIYLIRDRIGQKPLYYLSKNGLIYFSSELHCFFDAQLIEKQINPSAVHSYLSFLAVPAPETFFKEINSLKAGHYIKIKDHEIELKPYWNISDHLNKEIKDELHVAAEKTEIHLEKAISYRNISDVGISIALSGGLDSSLNAYYTSPLSPDAKCITISYKKTSKYDESKLAERFSKEMNLSFQNFTVDEKLLNETLPEYMSIQSDMPIGDPNTVLLYILSKLSRENGSKVLLVGEGGDEIGGYPKYHTAYKWHLFNRFSPINFGKLFYFLPSLLTSYFDNEVKGKTVPFSNVFGFSATKIKKIWNHKESFNSYEKVAAYMDEIRDDLPDSYYRKIANIEYKFRLPDLILPRIDYPSMAASIEARSPFLDYKLVEYSAGLNFKMKMGKKAKAVLKQVAKMKLPSYLFNQPKVGFGMLLTPFYEDVLPAWFKKEIIDDPNAPIKQFVKPKSLRKFLKSHQRFYRDGSRLWMLYALNYWLNLHFKEDR